MKQRKLHAKSWIVASFGGCHRCGDAITASAMTFVPATSGASANTNSGAVHQVRPHAPAQRADDIGRARKRDRSGTAFAQGFQYNTNYFCPAVSGNAPCRRQRSCGRLRHHRPRPHESSPTAGSATTRPGPQPDRELHGARVGDRRRQPGYGDAQNDSVLQPR